MAPRSQGGSGSRSTTAGAARVPGPVGLVRVLVAAAEREFGSGQPGRAQRYLDLVRGAATHPDSTWRRAAELLYQGGEFEAAGRAFGYAAAYDPGDAGLQAELARVCFSLGDLDSFDGYMRRALVLDPEHPLTLELIAEVNRDYGDPVLATDVLIRLLRTRPGATRYLRSLDRCWNRLGAAATAMSLVGVGPFGVDAPG